MDIDEALEKVGGYRRWHLTMFVLLGFSMFMPVCWQGLIIVFAGWEPPHRCRLLDNQTVNDSIPLVIGPDGKSTLSKCSMYAANATMEWNASRPTTECLYGWTYDNEGFYTIVEQWDLVCEHNYLSDLSQTLFNIGYLSSTLGLSFLIDRFGRKLVHIVSHLAICAVGIAIALSPSYAVFVILRCFLGVLIMANINSGLTYLMEIFDSKRRAFAGIGMEFPWVILYLLLPVAAYYIHDWRVLQIVISSLSAIWIMYFWILPESPLWLAAIGRYKEAERILYKMARWNNVPLGDNLVILERTLSKKEISRTDLVTAKQLVQVTAHDSICSGSLINVADSENMALQTMTTPSEANPIENGLSNENVKHLCRTPYKYPAMALIFDKYVRLVLLISNLLYFANCLVYYGLILSSPSLAGNRFVNFFVMGLVEIPAVVASFYTADKYGRRLSTCVYHILAGVPLAVVVFVPDVTSSGVDLTPLIITFIMISKFGISASFAIILLYTKELFPTNVRGTGGGICQILGNIGNIIAPFAAYLSKTSLYWLPNVIFGVISIVVGLLVLLLPETANKPLPQTVEDLHMMFKSMSSEKNNNKRTDGVEQNDKLKWKEEPSEKEIDQNAENAKKIKELE